MINWRFEDTERLDMAKAFMVRVRMWMCYGTHHSGKADDVLCSSHAMYSLTKNGDERMISRRSQDEKEDIQDSTLK